MPLNCVPSFIKANYRYESFSIRYLTFETFPSVFLQIPVHWDLFLDHDKCQYT